MSNKIDLLPGGGGLASRLAVVAGGVALALTAGLAVASADPDLGPAVNTTCSYEQVVAALDAQSPDAAAQFNASHSAQSWLKKFLKASPEKRQHMVDKAQAMPAAQEYLGLITQITGTCNNY